MKKIIALSILISAIVTLEGQSVIFLHHSTGAGIYSEGNVSGWITNYNSSNGTNYQVTERAYPNTPYPWANYPYDYWNLWINGQCNNTDPDIECMSKLTQDYDVIVFKHCFPGAAIQADNGNPLISSDIKTLANYRLQYRALRDLMDSYPQKKFIVWTLTPLHRLETTAADAARAREFVDWVKNTWLTEDGKSHPNIYIFDFFGLVAESNATPVNGQVNCLRYEYEKSHTNSDSHPNTLANQTVGPLFAQFIVNTIKNSTTGETPLAEDISIKVYPNPASSEITVDVTGYEEIVHYAGLYDMQGRLLEHRKLSGEHLITIDASDLAPGIYLLIADTSRGPVQHKVVIDR